MRLKTDIVDELTDQLEDIDRDFKITVKTHVGFLPFWKTEVELEQYNTHRDEKHD